MRDYYNDELRTAEIFKNMANTWTVYTGTGWILVEKESMSRKRRIVKKTHDHQSFPTFAAAKRRAVLWIENA